MTFQRTLRCLGTLALVAATVAAEETPREPEAKPKPKRERRERPNPLETLLAALDADGNQSLSTAEIDQAAAALKKLDKNGDGKLVLAEWQPESAERRNRFLKRFDKDGDGKISVEEAPERMLERWNQMDLNGDGVLEEAEMAQLRQRRGRRDGKQPREPQGLLGALDGNGDRTISAEEIAGAAAALRKLDRDGDGTLAAKELHPDRSPLGRFDKDGDGKLSREETPERMRERFDELDANGDGFLDEAEQKALRRRGGRKPKAKPDSEETN